MPSSVKLSLPNQNSQANFRHVQDQAQSILQDAKIGALDVDFILLLILALFTDALDIINLTGVGKILTIFIDIGTFFVMLLWGIVRGQLIEGAQESARQLLDSYNAEHGGSAQKKAKMMKFLTRQKVARGVIMKVLKRVGLALIAEIIPILGLLPWWTIIHFLSLGDKPKLEADA